MSDSMPREGDIKELKPMQDDFSELEEIVEPEKAKPEPQAAEAAPPVTNEPDMLDLLYKRTFAGMPAPAFNPLASKEYYRFLFGGILIVVGALMPFDHDWSHVGYKSFTGAMWLVIGAGVVWSMWAAINTGIFRARWVLLTIFPLLWGIMHMIRFDWSKFGTVVEPQWEGIHSFSKIGGVLQELGPGRLFILVGALLVEFTFLMGIFGGFKRKREQDAVRAAAARARRGK